MDPAAPATCPAGGYAAGVDTVDDRPRGADDERVVPLDEDDGGPLPEQTSDDTDQGWGERSWSNDDRLLADRPPHW